MSKKLSLSEVTIYTIGHAARPLEDFIPLLKERGITRLVDVRTLPKSRHNPQFNQNVLQEELPAVEIVYTHMPGLGGLRHTRIDSPNTGWHNDSFRGYADYMQTPEFERNLKALIKYAQKDDETLAVMCAETVPWRCHRSLIADALVVRGITVVHIISATHSQQHKATPWAQVDGTEISYPAQDRQESLPED